MPYLHIYLMFVDASHKCELHDLILPIVLYCLHLGEPGWEGYGLPCPGLVQRFVPSPFHALLLQRAEKRSSVDSKCGLCTLREMTQLVFCGTV